MDDATGRVGRKKKTTSTTAASTAATERETADPTLPQEADARAREIDRVHLLGETEAGQLQPVGAEGVRLDDLGARTEVRLMDADHEVGLRQVEVLERPVQEDALGIELRAHRAVADEHPLTQGLEEGLGHVP